MTDTIPIHSGSDNVFRDLGFPEGEAQNLMLRADLVVHIRKVTEKLDLTQAEAAKRASITQPLMNDLVKGRTEKFMLDAMVNVAAQLGYIVKLSLKESCMNQITLVAVADAPPSEVRLQVRLFKKAHPKAGGADFLQNLKAKSLTVMNAVVEQSLATARADDKFQLERHGYFAADRVDHAAGKPVFNLAVGFKDGWGQ